MTNQVLVIFKQGGWDALVCKAEDKRLKLRIIYHHLDYLQSHDKHSRLQHIVCNNITFSYLQLPSMLAIQKLSHDCKNGLINKTWSVYHIIT